MSETYRIAVIAYLRNEGYTESKVKEIIERYYNISISVWRYELNPEHFTEEIIRLYNLSKGDKN